MEIEIFDKWLISLDHVTYAVHKKANVVMPINRTPGEEPGIQRNLEELLKIKIRHLVDNGTIKTENSMEWTGSEMASVDIHVKISGDGTQVGHCSNIINITCTVLNYAKNANSPEGHEPIAIINGKENYVTLKAHLADIMIKFQNSLHIHTKISNSTLYTICVGITIFFWLFWVWPVPIPTIHVSNVNLSKHTFLMNLQAPRSEPLTKSLLLLINKVYEHKYCCLGEPIFQSIPIDRACFDILLLFLRVSDKLLRICWPIPWKGKTNSIVHSLKDIEGNLRNKKNIMFW